MSTRAPRESQTREKTERKKSWAPASRVPEPLKSDQYAYRWIRTSSLGQADNTNVSAKFREGWEPVRAEDHPELNVMSDIDSRFEGNVEVGGLLLCKNDKENTEARKEYYNEMAQRQMESVDNNYMRENDPRMPLLRPERSTKVSFGSGNS
jgi:hypothetical protein